ncbi:MAG: fused MFS/spermidine synthase [Sedimentisphaerales bacterium]
MKGEKIYSPRQSSLINRPYPLPPLPNNSFYAESPDPTSAEDNTLFLIENSNPFDFYHYRLLSVIYRGKTAFQNILIADTYNYGRILVLDGAIQSAECDEALYHEMLVQPTMLCHPDPHSVLIIGGGEGATLREVLAHRSVKSATMVDIDREVVELCREHLTRWHRGAFDEPRVQMVFEDGRKFIENDDAHYDVVIIDIVDMLDNGPAQALYTRQFYEILRRRLRPNAIVVVQGLEFSFLDYKEHAALAKTLRTVFPEVHSYRVHIPSFLSSWGFLIASDWFRPSEISADKIDTAIANRLGNDRLRHITGDYMKSCFCLCKRTRFMLSLPGPLLEDNVPFVAPPDIKDVEPPCLP